MKLIAYYLIYFIVRFFHLSYRYRYARVEKIVDLKKAGGNFIYGIWHQNLFGGILAQTGHNYTVIISRSKDGDPVALTCTLLGHIVARGSSKKGDVDKGGHLAKEEMIKYLKLGYPGAVTVDGPKGPVFKVKPGIVDMAAKSNAAIMPYTVYSKSYWQFRSWDHFRLPKPFSRLLIAYGDPIFVPSDTADYVPYQEKLETSLNELTQFVESNISDWNRFSKLNWHQLI